VQNGAVWWFSRAKSRDRDKTSERRMQEEGRREDGVKAKPSGLLLVGNSFSTARKVRSRSRVRGLRHGYTS